MSWKSEVQVSGEPDAWTANALRFATQAEASHYGLTLMRRWTLVEHVREMETPDEPVNCTVDEHGNSLMIYPKAE